MCIHMTVQYLHQRRRLSVFPPPDGACGAPTVINPRRRYADML